jgi:hypothetical protein
VLTATAERTIGIPVAELVWPYPPTTSVPLALLGRLPPGRAVSVWIGIHVLALLLIGRLALGTWLRSPAALFFPGSALALFTGQISPLIALLLSLVVFFHARRPIGAGVSLGLMVIKPHYAIVPGLVMLRERRPTVAIVAILTTLTLVAISLVWFGVETWRQFVAAAVRHGTSVLAEAPMSRFVSVFSALHSVGVRPGIALILHGGAALIALVLGFRLWRAGVEPSTQALGLAAATLLVTPYALDYDLVLLVLPWLLLIRESLDRPELARRQFWPWLSLTLLVPPSYILPLYTHRSIGGVLLLAILLWTRMRARTSAG